MKAWLVIDNWKNKYPDLLDGYNARLFTIEYNAKQYRGCLKKTDNAILKEIELPEQTTEDIGGSP